MPQFDRFLIAPFETGLQTNMRPWLIMDDAFQALENAYVFRGRVRKRFGGTLMGSGASSSVIAPFFSRLGFNIGTTDGAGNFTTTVPGSIFQIGQQFVVGTTIFTVFQLGTPAAMLSTGTATGTFNTTTGVVTITSAAPLMAVFFFTDQPVMGITNYDETSPIDDQPSYAFDTQFAYVFAGGRWSQSPGTPTWHGDDDDFFWSTNYTNTVGSKNLFTTNFFAQVSPLSPSVNDDPIYSFDGTTWSFFSYQPNAILNPTNRQPLTVTRTTTGNNQIIANYVQQARIILPFKNRLILLNVVENNANGATAFVDVPPPAVPNYTTTGITPANYLTSTNTQFVNRCRYSHNGSPFASNAWLEQNQTYNPGATGVVIADGGGFLDAATDEQIVSAEFIKDRLIVYFERSTWELAYTGNELRPFVWQKINTELGSESTFSTVPFDKEILTIANVGVHSCNGTNVQRIDTKIPDLIFEVNDENQNTGVERVCGIRDYFVETVYWAYPQSNNNPNQVFPNKVLVYNYRNSSWAINDDCITTFGYFEQQTGLTWATAVFSWSNADFEWDSGTIQAQSRQVIAGNQQGFIFIVDADMARNAPVMEITNITAVSATVVQLVVINHMLAEGDYVLLENSQGVTNLNGGIFPVFKVIDINTITIASGQSIIGFYTGGGTLTRVSNINILSKQWNPYDKKGQNVYLSKIDFAVQKTASGQITVDYFPSSTELSMVNEGTQNGAIIGTNVLETSPYDPLLYPLEEQQTRLWHSVYFQTEGECIQLNMYMSPFQIVQPTIALSDFELEGIVLLTMPVSTRLQ